MDTIRWDKGYLRMIDQTALPGKLRYLVCATDKEVTAAIRDMKVRGAPAIGIAAAYGVYLGVRNSRASDFNSFRRELKNTEGLISKARPTARNLFWALERMHACAIKNKTLPVEKIKKRLLEEAGAILEEDNSTCRSIGRNGARLIGKGCTVLTHCNAGGLATGGYGTALGVIFSASKKIKHVYADETRPRLQGARLTMWELKRAKIPASLICDNMAAVLMAEKEIDAVIVGADRIASNGDTANKIGTYSLAVNAAYHKVPFYVAAPLSTFDMSLRTGKDIPIESRSHDEVKIIGREHIAPKNADVINPAFDVTPARLVTAIVTERGVIRGPNAGKIRRQISDI